MSAALAIGHAIVDRLRTDAPLQTKLGGVTGNTRVYIGRAPDVNKLPYVVVGNLDGAPGGAAQTFDADANADVQQVRAWGVDEWAARELGALVEAALAAPLTLAGHVVVRAAVLSRRTVTDPDGKAAQYLIRLGIDSQVTTP